MYYDSFEMDKISKQRVPHIIPTTVLKHILDWKSFLSQFGLTPLAKLLNRLSHTFKIGGKEGKEG